MEISAEALIEHSRMLLSAIRSGTQDHLLPELAGRRREEMLTVEAALQQGSMLSSDTVLEIQQLDKELLTVLSHRRDEVGAELVAFQRGRRAGVVYRGLPSRAPRFVDRSS